MGPSIENAFKDAGFSDKQIKALIPAFEKAYTPTPENTLATEVAELKGRMFMLTWAVAVVAAVFLGMGTLLYQRISSVETTLNQRIDDLKTDISEVRANQSEMRTNQANIQKEVQDIRINQVNMQRDIQAIKALLEKRAVSSERTTK